jgi:energy-coupling factor transporter ATP-binding protein EcfA2
MKINKIEVCDFRGFPGPAVYDFEFGAARNIFVYGENGSGKSSLFRAIQEFYNTRPGRKPFADHKNTLAPTCTEGRVTVHYDDGSVHSWQYGAERPLNQPPTSQTRLSVGCIDYRSLLETNFTQRNEQVNLFDLAINHLLPHRETYVEGTSRTVRERWNAIGMPYRRTNAAVTKCHRSVDRFNTAFEPLLVPLMEKATTLLAKFPGPALEIGAAYRPVQYQPAARRLNNQELILSVRIQGNDLPNHHNILNEARLSAIGLVIYLSGLLTSVPATSQFPKLLVLDDVLIGLDMANRMPVLQILKEDFADWQIILLTHDRVWYEMVQVEMTGNEWKGYELWLGEDGMTPLHRARDGGPDFFLARARQHLTANDERASAVYTRAAFEVKVKGYCDDVSVPVPYKKEARRMTADSFWQAAKARSRKYATDHNPTDLGALNGLFQAVDAAQRVVLNPLSHSATQPVTRPEIQAAIDAVANLRFR